MSVARKTHTVHCISEALSPITHMSGTAGNESLVAREPVHTPRGVVLIPFLSGNALRHRCVREPGMLWLIERYGLRGALSLGQLNLLLHGGNLSQSTAHEDTRRIADMHRVWPLLRICGGSLPNQILAGSLDVWRGVLVCEENRETIEMTIGSVPDARLMSAERFAANYQYTRGDGKKTGIARHEEAVAAEEAVEVDEADTDGNAKKKTTNQMIYSGQCVGRGAVFHHGFVLKHATSVELGALILSLQLWQAAGGTIGGNARIGHGRLHTSLYCADNDLATECGTCVDEYIAYVDSVKDEAIQWLADAFTAKAQMREKKKQRKAVANGQLAFDGDAE